MADFKLSYRNLALRFFVDKTRHQLLPTNTMRLRCLSQIDNFFPAHRETNKIVSIRKSQFPDLLNQKLTNHRSIHSGGGLCTPSSLVSLLCLVFVLVPSRGRR